MDLLTFSSAETTAILLTLKVATASVAFSLPLAIAIAWLLARRRFPGKTLLDGAVHLPLVLPPVVIGYALLLVFSPAGPGGVLLDRLFGIGIAFRWTGAALAAAIMGFPLMVRAIRLSIEAVDTRLELAARSLGRGPFSVFLTITLPLMAPGILAGVILAFARGLGEFGATITFVSNIPGETQTLPIAIYSFLQVPGADAAVLRLAILAVVLSLASLFAYEWLARRMHRGQS
jgi:molybdate transport system permease protein